MVEGNIEVGEILGGPPDHPIHPNLIPPNNFYPYSISAIPFAPFMYGTYFYAPLKIIK